MEAILRQAEAIGVVNPPGIEESYPLQSKKFIDLLKDLYENNARFEYLTTELQDLTNVIKFSDQITKVELDRKKQIITDYCNGISTFIEQKSYALSLLQQTFSSEHFIIDHRYHKYYHQQVDTNIWRMFHDLLVAMSRRIASFKSDYQAVLWCNTNIRETDPKLETLLVNLSAVVARYQRFHEALATMRTTVHNLNKYS